MSFVKLLLGLTLNYLLVLLSNLRGKACVYGANRVIIIITLIKATIIIILIIRGSIIFLDILIKATISSRPCYVRIFDD